METNPFSFWIPLDFEKSIDDSERRICGIISTEDVDLEGEIVREQYADYSPMLLQMGKNIGAALADTIDWDRFSTRAGFLKWEHGSEPGNIIGIPERVEKGVVYKDPISNVVKSGTAIWGRLFGPDAGIEKANEAWALVQAIKKSGFKRPLGYSIEGAYLPRPDLQKSEKSCMVTGVVLTGKPVNSWTWADMAKALVTGGGITDSAQLTGGGALTKQSIWPLTDEKKNKKKKKCEHETEAGFSKGVDAALKHLVICKGIPLSVAKQTVIKTFRRAA